MRNLILFCTVLSPIMLSLFIGVNIRPKPVEAAWPKGASAAIAVNTQQNIPFKGSVQVLNGCGVTGAADRMAGFLRDKNFDVKDIANAPTWNYPSTMVISRTQDLELAQELAKILKTDKVVLIRTGEKLYDATVVTGPDFEDKIGEKK